LWSAAGGIGIAIGPLAGGYLLEHWWWGSIFLVNVPFVVLALVADRGRPIPDSRDPLPGRVDRLGVLLSTAGIVCGRVRHHPKPDDRADWTAADVLGPLAGGLVLLAGLRNRRAAAATTPLWIRGCSPAVHSPRRPAQWLWCSSP